MKSGVRGKTLGTWIRAELPNAVSSCSGGARGSRCKAVANALSWASSEALVEKHELKSFQQPVPDKDPHSLAVTNWETFTCKLFEQIEAARIEWGCGRTFRLARRCPYPPIREARALPPQRGSSPVNRRVKSARRAQACRHSHQILGLAVQDAETKQHFTPRKTFTRRKVKTTLSKTKALLLEAAPAFGYRSCRLRIHHRRFLTGKEGLGFDRDNAPPANCANWANTYDVPWYISFCI